MRWTPLHTESGIGIRDQHSGEWLEPHSIGLPTALADDIVVWAEKYRALLDRHDEDIDESSSQVLDEAGIALAHRIRLYAPHL